MSDICLKQMPVFKKAYKKLPRSHQLMVNDVIKAIIQNPEIGDEKEGIYLASIFINLKFIIKNFF